MGFVVQLKDNFEILNFFPLFFKRFGRYWFLKDFFKFFTSFKYC